MRRVRDRGFSHQPERGNEGCRRRQLRPPRESRHALESSIARLMPKIFGPTTGDRVRLGDTALILEVEADHTVYGDECRVRRREGAPRRDGSGLGRRTGRGARLRHHQLSDRRLDWNLQNRHQGSNTASSPESAKQVYPRRHGRGQPWDDRRRHHRGHRRRGPHRDGRRRRAPISITSCPQLPGRRLRALERSPRPRRGSAGSRATARSIVTSALPARASRPRRVAVRELHPRGARADRRG